VIHLPPDWSRSTAAALARCLVDQLASEAEKSECIHGLISSSLRLLCKIWKDRHALETLGPMHWRIGGLEYKYVPIVDDRALAACEQFIDAKRTLALIAPSESERLLGLVVREVCPGQDVVVTSLDWVLSFRMCDLAVHYKLSHQDCLCLWLETYNNEIQHNEQLSVDLSGAAAQQ
jgi:hypothetical protein